MGNLRETLQTIRTDLGSSGLDVASSSLRALEETLTTTKNARVGFRGVLEKVNKMRTLNYAIVEPSTILPGSQQNIDIRPVAADWVPTSIVSGNAAVIATEDGAVTFYGSQSDVSPTAQYTLSRKLKEVESYNDRSAGNFSTLRFTMQAPSLFTTAIAAATDPGLYIGFATSSSRYLSFGFSNLGMYYTNVTGVYTLFPGTAGLFNVNTPVHVELRCSWVTTIMNVALYVNGVLINTVNILGGLATPTNTFLDVTMVTTTGLASSELAAGKIVGVSLRDTVLETASAAPITAIFSRSRYREDGFPSDRRMYVATAKGLWFDENESGLWRFASKLKYPETYTTSFRDSTILFNYKGMERSELLQIGRDFSIKVLDDAPNIRFGVAHNNHIFGAGDPKYPLRLYFCGDRAPNVWFAPDEDADGQETIDEVLTAGYFEIASNAGDRISACWGDYYGNLIIATAENKLFRLAGYNFQTYAMSKLDDSAGAMGPHCMQQVGNDVWAVDDNGLVSIQAVQQYGDMVTKRVSAPIQSVFSSIASKKRGVCTPLKDKTRLLYEKSSGQVFMILTQPDGENDKIYVYNVAMDRWHGPWETDTTCAAILQVDTPRRQALVLGTSTGLVKVKCELQDASNTVVIESQLLNGRSISPNLPGMEKTWRNMRILSNQVGNWPVTVEYKIEDKPWQTLTKYLVRSTSDVIGTTWEVGTSEVRSNEEVLLHDFRIDSRGKTFKYRLTTSAPKMSLIGIEIDFSYNGVEKGD